MWGLLITILLAAIIFMINPFKSMNFKSPTDVKRTENQVNQVVEDVSAQVEYARNLQQAEQERLK